jgi:hypothetical protein
MEHERRKLIESRLKDIKEHPEKHQHDYEALMRCCQIGGMTILELMDAHQGTSDPDRPKCDTNSGPCACGAWH